MNSAHSFMWIPFMCVDAFGLAYSMYPTVRNAHTHTHIYICVYMYMYMYAKISPQVCTPMAAGRGFGWSGSL